MLISCYLAHLDLHSFPHDALPISTTCAAASWPSATPPSSASHPSAACLRAWSECSPPATVSPPTAYRLALADRKSTRLNSSHLGISYAVFCLKKKTITTPSR